MEHQNGFQKADSPSDDVHYDTNVKVALAHEFVKITNSTKHQKVLIQQAINKIINIGFLDAKGRELVNENFLFCMLCRNKIWGLTNLIPDFAADYLTLQAHTEFLNTFESCGVSGPHVEIAVADFIELMKERPC